PDAVDSVLATALAKDPDDRYPTCGVLMSAAEDALGLRRTQPRRRRTALLVAAAAIIAALSAAAATAVVAAGGHTPKVNAPLLAGPNTLARIDPKTNKVSAVVGVGDHPIDVAAAGHIVWAYNRDDASISEVDATRNRVLKTTSISGFIPSECCSVFAGPVLAADHSGAWFVNGGDLRKPWLTHVIAGRGTRR